MKKFCVLSLLLFVPLLAIGEQLGVFYKDEEAVKNEKATFATVVQEGLLVPANVLTGFDMKPLVGKMKDVLRHGEIIRVDTKLNVALIGLGEKVKSVALQKSYESYTTKLQTFLPSLAEKKVVVSSSKELEEIPYFDSSDPFQVKIDGKELSDEPIELSVKRKKSNFRLEVVRTSTSPVWQVQIYIESNPKLGFWKKGRQKGLNDVPRPKFKYFYQSMFKPLKPGKSFTVPVEVSYIKGTSYTWTVSLKSKGGKFERKIPIQFKS